MRACRRETAGSVSCTALPGARPIVSSRTSGTCVRSARTSSYAEAAGVRGAPQLGHEAAARLTCRRHARHVIGTRRQAARSSRHSFEIAEAPASPGAAIEANTQRALAVRAIGTALSDLGDQA